MKDWKYRLTLLVPATEQSQEWLSRAMVAVCEEGLAGGQRRSIINQGGYDPENGFAKLFNNRIIIGDIHYAVRSLNLTQEWWDRLQSVLQRMPPGGRYIKRDRNSEGAYVIVESNMDRAELGVIDGDYLYVNQAIQEARI